MELDRMSENLFLGTGLTDQYPLSLRVLRLCVKSPRLDLSAEAAKEERIAEERLDQLAKVPRHRLGLETQACRHFFASGS